MNLKNEATETKLKVEQLEIQTEKDARLIDDNKKQFLGDVTRLERDADRIRGMMNTTRINLEKMIRESQLFNKEEANKVKGVVNIEWPRMK